LTLLGARSKVRAMRILFRKLSDQRHVLELVRDDGRREQVECETRSYLTHDLLHYAVESEAKLQSGFWGLLAAGKTLVEMNDRVSMSIGDPVMETVEMIVGVLSGTVKGISSAELVGGFRILADATATQIPAWLTEPFVDAVRERMRRLLGQWTATPYRSALELGWPA
jgi:hypothetical protein